MTLQIRSRKTADLPPLAEILIRVHARDGYPVEGVSHPIAWLTPSRQIAAWTALLNDRIIGQIAVKKAEHDDVAITWQEVTGRGIEELAIPARLFIDPDYRRKGAGKSLLRACREFAENEGLHIAFDVMLKDQAAITLYESEGYTKIGTADHHHSAGLVEPAVIYSL